MAKTSLVPLADRVVVSVPPRNSISGIILPEGTGQESPERGVIVAIGKGRRTDAGENVPLEVSVGDEVVFAQYSAEKVVLDNEEFFILREDQLLAIVK